MKFRHGKARVFVLRKSERRFESTYRDLQMVVERMAALKGIEQRVREARIYV
jgi:hypothetical protein